jgi:alpha-1,3-rhamnosyl/mannosyltransferase
VVVGDNRTYPKQDLASQADALGLHDVVDWIEYAGDERLAALYARARVFVFVSEYEGFGLTPLEALAAGVPPVVADTAVSHETCGNAALYVEPGDAAGLAAAIRSLLLDDSTRSRLLEAAPSVLSRYSWDRAAGETLELIENVGRR